MVAVVVVGGGVFRDGNPRGSRRTYEKTTSEGKESPALIPDIMMVVVWFVCVV